MMSEEHDTDFIEAEDAPASLAHHCQFVTANDDDENDVVSRLCPLELANETVN